MPTYGYRCKNGHQFEVFQTFSDAPLQRCPQCRAKINRVFYPVGIVFKGQGFYKTDSRKADPNGAAKPEKAAAEKPATDKPATDKPAADRNSADKPAADRKKSEPKGSSKADSKSD
jgi:putative FmdB family regulatory protein